MNDFFLNLIHSHHLINHGRTVLRWLLIVTIIWVSFLSVSAQAPSASTSAYSCSGQLPTKDSRYNGRVIQQKLKVIYQPDAAYQAALKSNGRLLTDGIFGPVTRQWLIKFCNDFNVSDTVSETSGSSSDFVDTTLKDLARAAEISAVFPNWRDSVDSGELLTLSSSQLAQLLAPDLIPGSTDSSSSGSQTNIPSYYYQLTDNDLNRQATLTALTALGKQQFSQRNELYNQLVTLIDQLDVTFNPALDLNSFIQSQSIDQATQSNSKTESTTTSQTSKNSDATEPDSSSDTTIGSGSSPSSSSNSSSTSSSAPSSSSNTDSTASSASDSNSSSTETQALNRKQANEEFWRQTQSWKQGVARSAQPEQMDAAGGADKNDKKVDSGKKDEEVAAKSAQGQLKIVSPDTKTDTSAVSDQAADTDMSQADSTLLEKNKQLESDLASALESVDQMQRENAEKTTTLTPLSAHYVLMSKPLFLRALH